PCSLKVQRFTLGALGTILAIKADLHRNILELPNQADRERGQVAIEKLDEEFFVLLRVFQKQGADVRGTFDPFLEKVYLWISKRGYNSSEIFNHLANGVKAGRLSRYVTIASSMIWGGAIDEISDLIYTNNRKLYDAILSERTIPQQDVSILALLLIEFVSRTHENYFELRKACREDIATPFLEGLLSTR
ncbi:MAG: hypothetical protein ABL958_15365, partial [Bdellovibrionia bacterium]